MHINQLSAYKVDKVVLQEIRWTGSRILEKQDCTLFYSCDNKDHILGTGFLVSKRIKHLIIDFKRTTPRICTLRMRGKFFNYSVVKGRAPTETSDEEKDGCFHAPETVFNIRSRNNIKIVLGNFNAQVGNEAINFPTIGQYSLQNLMNDNGSQLIQFAVSWNMITGSTFYPHKAIHNGTWRLPDGVIFTLIDHLLIDRRHKSKLMDVRSY